MTFYLFTLTLGFLIPLALALVLYQSKRDIAAKSNDECTELELDGSHAQALSPEEIHAYYLSLYEKLGSLCTGSQKVFSRKTSPLINHRLELDDRNMISISEKKESHIQYTPGERIRIAKAIFQLANAYASNSRYKDITLLSQGIAPLLLYPFIDLYDKTMPQLIKIKADYRQLVFSYTRKEALMEQSELALANICARVIQRAYRQRLFQKQARPLEEFSSELKQSMFEHSIRENPTQPKPFSEFTPQYKMQWAQNARADLKPAAVMLMKYCVMYRSHAKFTRRLAAVVQLFNKYLYSLPEKNRDYILVAPNKKGSNQWVIGLVLPLLIKKPMAILHPEEIRAFRAENDSLTHMVFIDDALYSGRQMSELVLSSQRQAALNKILIVPYYTDRSLACFDRSVQFILGERMLRYENLKSMYCKESEEPWTHDTTIKCDEIFSREWTLASLKVGTFFNHKIADDASTYLRAGSEKSLASFHSENKDPLEICRCDIHKPY